MKTAISAKAENSLRVGILRGGAKTDFVALSIVATAIILFIVTGMKVAPDLLRYVSGRGAGPDPFTINIFLLNAAIIIFAWHRYGILCDEITARKAAENTARELAKIDPLTNSLNRRGFYAGLNHLIAQSHEQRQTVAVLMIDLDDFKQVNDQYGHSAGDALLCECAHRIRTSLRKDTLIGRIGGDEFAVAVLFDPQQPSTVDHIADRLVKAISAIAQVQASNVHVTASIGLARSDDMDELTVSDLSTPAALMEMADIAMYHSKNQGRNTFSWFESPMAEEKRLRADLETGIRQGVINGEFVPYYEQQIDLQTGQLSGFEMLARWHSPQFGVVRPDVFIPVAETIGAIAEVSQSVIKQALQDAKAWPAHLTLAVNISPVQLRDPWFAQKLLRMLVEANFPPQRLEVEITESCLHHNLPQARSLITSLKNQGIRVSLDDFGTGYSSIGQLRNLSFDRIKIDRSFVSSIFENKDNAAIVHAMATLGKGLDLPVTAEGIETQDVLDHLLQYGGITGQGYLYGRPRPASELQEWLGDTSRQETVKADLEDLFCAPIARRA